MKKLKTGKIAESSMKGEAPAADVELTAGHASQTPIPAARPLGAVAASIGVVLLFFNHFGGLFPRFFWEEGAPALGGFLAGVLIGIGLLFCCWRFTLGFLVCIVITVAGSAAIGHWSGRFWTKTIRFDSWKDSYDIQASLRNHQFEEDHTSEMRSAVKRVMAEQQRFIDDGLLRAVRDSGFDWGATDPLHAKADAASGQLALHWRPHVEKRFNGIQASYREYLKNRFKLMCLSVEEGSPSKTKTVRQGLAAKAATLWCRAVRIRFGERAALLVATRSTAIVEDVYLRQAFRKRGLHLRELDRITVDPEPK